MLGARTRMLMVCMLLVLSGGALSVGVQPAFAAAEFSLESSFGAQGTGLGDFEGPRAVAVEASTGDVFVMDVGNARVQKLEPQAGGGYQPVGEIATWGPKNNKAFKLGSYSGIAVDDSSGAFARDVYVASSKYVFQFKPKAGDPNEYEYSRTLLESPSKKEPVDGVAVDSSGHVYVTYGQSLSVLEPTGTVLASAQALSSPAQGAAVAGGYVYLTGAAMGLERYKLGAGYELEEGTVIATAPAGAAFQALAAGGEGHVYVDAEEAGASHVEAFAASAPAGSAPVEEFAMGEIGASSGIAYSDRKGHGRTVYVSDATSDEVHVFGYVGPPEVTKCGATPTAEGATVACTIAPEAPQATWKLAYRPIGGGGFSEVLSGTITAPGEVKGEITGLEPASEYDYSLSATNTNSGSGEARVEEAFRTKPRAPLPVPSEASGVSERAATLNGTVNPENSGTTQIHFQYGPCVSEASCYMSPYPESTPVTSVASGYGAVALSSEPVEGLQPGTAYHYRLVATNPAGEAVSEQGASFTTVFEPAQAFTGPASEVSQTEATISGTINPNGQLTTYTWEIGTSTSYGTSITGSISSPPGEAGTPESIAHVLTGLLPTTTYHYRLIASNNRATVYGADQTFTTPAYPPEALTLTAPSSPALLPALLPVPAPPANGGVLGAKAVKPTKAQKLSKALKACKKDVRKSKRLTCEKAARKKYASKQTAHKQPGRAGHKQTA